MIGSRVPASCKGGSRSPAPRHEISKGLNDSYKAWLESKGESASNGVDYQLSGPGNVFLTLKPSHSPVQHSKVIVRTYTRFVEFYDVKHNGRKLTWLWHLCKGELDASYCKATKAPYTFQVSTYQMAMFLLFNDATRISYEEIEKFTGLPKEYMEPVLQVS